jgi:diguanylate cyclase (GGDEF)-like protein/PAS domain S-box-containing protein
LLLILAYNFKYYESERLKEELNNKIEELTDAVLVQFSNKNPMQDWIPKEKAVTEINHIFSDNISDLIMIKSLDDVHFIIYGNKNDKQQKLYESSNKSDLDQNWSSSKIFKYANQEWNIVAYSTTKFFFNHASWIIWWLLTVGFLFIAILGAGLLVITGTNLMIKDRVIEKTKEINQLLSILKESEHKYKQLIEIQPVIFWRYLLGAKQLDYVSDEATNLLGYNKSELLDVEIVLDKMFHPADRDRVIKEFYLGIQSNKRFSIKYRAQGKNGKMFWFKDYISTKSYDDKTEVVGLKIDITAEQIKENKIFQLAFYDSMTQLPNRIKFIEYLDDAIVQSEINHTFGAILYLDLDRFKILNDSMGHYFGDKLLIEISRRLSSLLSYSDVISRFGSDEFVILLAEQNKFKKELKTYVRAMVEKIQEEINKVFKIDEHNIYSSCSIGISVFPSNSSQVNEVIQQADTAMYFAKSIGKNSYIFFKSKMKKNAEKKLQIEKSLKIALLRQEFEMYYQPIFDENKNFIKYESLLRWNHPEKGIVSPDSFIYIAEETGFIIELSEWVIDNVFSYIHNLNKNNLPVLPISINISLLQFENTGFVAVLQSIRDKYQINSNRVILELTESIGIGDFNSTLKKIHKLKNLGFKLAIDDFGTGYSSLNYLTQMPIDILKLDKEFVAKIGSSERADALVETIVLMAQHLKLEMIVEGVETEQQFEFLKRLGCKQFQGYLVSKAISVSRITQIPI